MATTIISGSDSTQRTLVGTDYLWVSSSTARYRAAGPLVTWGFATPSSTGIKVENYGLMESLSGRVFDTGSTAATSATSFTLLNRAGASIIGATDVMRVQSSIAGGSMTLTNSGSIQANGGRGFDIQEYSGLANFSFTNNAGSTLQSTDDGIRLTSATAGLTFAGTVSITNSGTMRTVGAGSGEAIDLTDVNATISNRVTITNNVGATIEAADSDAIRGSVNTKINNYGTIQGKSVSASSTTSDGIDFQANGGGVVNNFQGGQIIGARHGITGTKSVTVTNDGAITGQAGNGINLGTLPNTTATITNNSHGVITGNATATTDGDGIHVSGLVSIDNSGTIRGLGTVNGGLTEAISAGGGSIYNYSNGLMYSDERAITIDDGNGGSAFALAHIVNYGTITGANGEAISIVGSFGDSIWNQGGTINGSISTDGGNDEVVNYSLINGAVSLGAGDDGLSLRGGTVGAVDGGTGNDSLTVVGTGTLNGSLTGIETVILGSSVYGTQATLNVTAGLGGADILFITGSQTLKIGTGALASGDFNDKLIGFGAGDNIDLAGFTARGVSLGAGNVLTVTGTTGNVTLHLDPAQDFSAYRFAFGSDGAGGTLLSLVPNSAPVTSASSNAGDEDQQISGSVLASDANGDALTYALVSGPQHGSLVFNSDGSYLYTPNANFHGDDAFSFVASDGAAQSASATVSLTVSAVNDAPVLGGAQASLAAGTEDQSYTVTAAQLIAGFSDVDGDALLVANLSVSSGSVVDNGDGTWTITQGANFNGAVTLSYSVVDGNGGSVAASLGYAINAVNDGPVLSGTQAVLSDGAEDQSYTVTAAQLIAGFSDVDGDALSIASLSASSGSVVDNGDGTWTITQGANFNGAVTLSYSVVDGNGGSVAASLGYAINAVNDGPVLSGTQTVLSSGNEDTSYTVTAAQLIAGFSDVDGDALSIASLAASSGSVVDNGDGTWTITQGADFNGPVTLSYSVVDGNGGSVAASLGYAVNAVNDSPIGGVSIAGTAASGQMLSASNTLADADGLGSIGYQWLRDGQVISGAVGETYVVQQGDIGHTISVAANYVDAGGTSERILSSATQSVVQGAGTFTGGSGNDTLTGSNFDDILNGLAGNDILRALGGNDVIRGGAGNDTVDGGAGIDTASYSDATKAVKVSLAVTGAQVTGGSGTDTLIAVENLIGSAYADTLTGNSGANVLSGGAGADTLTGGAGADTFVFDTLASSANRDSVKDFVSGTDKLQLSIGAFAGLSSYGLGQLDASELAFGTRATTSSQHLIYDAKSGTLMYDPDGSGGAASVTIAVLGNGSALHAQDIILVG